MRKERLTGTNEADRARLVANGRFSRGFPSAIPTCRVSGARERKKRKKALLIPYVGWDGAPNASVRFSFGAFPQRESTFGWRALSRSARRFAFFAFLDQMGYLRNNACVKFVFFLP